MTLRVVYIVEADEYSDRFIAGVYADKSLADEHVTMLDATHYVGYAYANEFALNTQVVLSWETIQKLKKYIEEGKKP